MREVTAYVLAGGRSSRMGRDKALLELHGRLLIERAVEKLGCVAGRVCVSGSRPELARYAELVPDLREGAGPLGGVEAALAHAKTDWVLMAAVDMPFFPVGALRWMIEAASAHGNVRGVLFSVDGRPQPALALLHREMAGGVSGALNGSDFRLFPALCQAAGALAQAYDVEAKEVLRLQEIGEPLRRFVSREEWQQREYWFANLNTPEEFQAAADLPGLRTESSADGSPGVQQ